MKILFLDPNGKSASAAIHEMEQLGHQIELVYRSSLAYSRLQQDQWDWVVIGPNLAPMEWLSAAAALRDLSISASLLGILPESAEFMPHFRGCAAPLFAPGTLMTSQEWELEWAVKMEQVHF